MTLIVGFRCGDSAVLCADSQETRGFLKTEVDKLPIRSAHGGMDVVCGGAGHGELMDAFRLRVMDALVGSATCGESDIRTQIETALVAFHRSPVYKSFPGDTEDKYIAGLIAVRDVQRKVFLYKFFNSVVQPVETYGLAGEDSAFLDRLVKRRHRSGLSVHQAVLLGIEVVSEARHISAHVGGPIRVVIATSAEGIRAQEQDRIQWTEAEITTQNDVFDALRFELTSTNTQVEQQLKTFSNSITSIRGVYGLKFPAWPKPTLTDDEDEPR